MRSPIGKSTQILTHPKDIRVFGKSQNHLDISVCVGAVLDLDQGIDSSPRPYACQNGVDCCQPTSEMPTEESIRIDVKHAAQIV